MLLQEEMIQTVHELCTADAALEAALMYGSFAKGEGDRFSDIEFWCFFEVVPDREAWIERIAPLRGLVRNEYGTEVALFENGVRGEFHLKPASELESVRGWTGERGGVRVLVDRKGRLEEAIAESDREYKHPERPGRLQALCDALVSNLLLGDAVLKRGELARALDTLSHVQRHLLWLVRIDEGIAEPHRATPSRFFEREISAENQERYAKCTAPLEAEALGRSYSEARQWAAPLMDRMAERAGIESRSGMLQQE